MLNTVGRADVMREAPEPMCNKIGLACVFGSLAAGNATAESDVDLHGYRAGLREIAPLLSAAADTLDREIIPVEVSENARPLAARFWGGEGLISIPGETGGCQLPSIAVRDSERQHNLRSECACRV